MSAEPRVRRELLRLAEQGALDAAAFERAMEIAGVRPDGARWLAFLRAACVVGGALLAGAALIYFIAYNWQGMSRLVKIALIGAAVVASAGGGIGFSPRSLLGRASLLLATLCLGALLAFIGQTYQTGADSYQLFVAWAVLALPWAIAAAWPPLWALELVLANFALGLWLGLLPHTFFLAYDFSFAIVLAVLNAAAAGLAEAARANGMGRLLPRLAAVLALAFSTASSLEAIFAYEHHLEGVLVFVILVALAFWQYRVRQIDVVILAAGALGVICVVAAGFAKAMSFAEGLGWMLIALIVTALSAGAAHWLRGLAREAALEEGEAA